MFILWVLFYLMCFFLVGMIILQQSKGDIGFAGTGQNALTQQMFGGSGGLELFEKVTWVFGFIFLISCLSISYYQSKDSMLSVLDTYKDTVYLTQNNR